MCLKALRFRPVCVADQKQCSLCCRGARMSLWTTFFLSCDNFHRWTEFFTRQNTLLKGPLFFRLHPLRNSVHAEHKSSQSTKELSSLLQYTSLCQRDYMRLSFPPMWWMEVLPQRYLFLHGQSNRANVAFFFVRCDNEWSHTFFGIQLLSHLSWILMSWKKSVASWPFLTNYILFNVRMGQGAHWEWTPQRASLLLVPLWSCPHTKKYPPL